MKTLIALALAASALPVLAQAAELHLKDVVAEVRIVPEARPDFAVSISRNNPALPALQVRRTASGVVVDGGLNRRIRNCGGVGGVRIKDGPRIARKDMPQITVRAPMAFAVRAEGVVSGTVGNSHALNLRTEGCGDWNLGDTAQRLDIRMEGFGDVNAGRAGSLNIAMEGMGDADVASVSGPVDASVQGMGDLKIKGGRASLFKARLEGMGSIRFDGAAGDVDASADGMGSIRVAHATGRVNTRKSGFASVKVGR